MGACTSGNNRPLKDVYIPYPTSLEDFQTFGHVNIMKSLHFLASKARKDAKKPGAQQLAGPYAIKPLSTGAKIVEMAVTDPSLEVLKVIVDYSKRDRNRAGHTVGRIQPEEIREGGDEQLRARVYSALLRSRSIVLSANFKYCGPLDIVRLNHMLKLPYPIRELRHLINVFIKLDTSGNGLISAEELATWFEHDSPGIVSSIFFRFIFQLVACASGEGACAEEFMAIVNHICTMNEEEITRHVFDCLANAEDHFLERYCELKTITERFPALITGDSALNLENKTFVKEYTALMDTRKRSMDDTTFERQGSQMKFNDFVDMKRRSQYLLHSLIFAQTFIRKKLFGEHFWREREKELRALEGYNLQDPERSNSVAMKYYAQAKLCLFRPTLPYQVQSLSTHDASRFRAISRRSVNSKRFNSKMVPPLGITSVGRESGASTDRRRPSLGAALDHRVPTTRRPSVSSSSTAHTARRRQSIKPSEVKPLAATLPEYTSPTMPTTPEFGGSVVFQKFEV